MALNKKKTISFIGSVGIPARYGGFETLVEQLAKRLSIDYNIIVFCSAKNYSTNERQQQWNSITRYFIRFKANGLQSIIYDFISLIKAIRLSDTICILGSSGGAFLPFLSFILRKKKIIFHPDGKEWARKKWSFISGFFLYFSIKSGCRAANYIIIDNKALSPHFKKFKNKIIHCSYGGDQFKLNSEAENIENYWLTIARAEPENNLKLIAEAFNKSDSQNWVLISNYNQTKFGKKLYEHFKNSKNITFIPSAYIKKDLEGYLSKCKGYIHGHSAGGTNPSLTSAMWLNKPLICHNNSFNRNTTQSKALFFSSIQELQILLEENRPLNNKLTEEALSVAKQNYTWEKIVQIYKTLFETIIQN